VSLVFPVSLLAITAMGGGIGAGATSAVARALGAGRREEAATLGGQALVLAALLGLAFGLGAWLGVGPLFRLMGASGAVHEGASAFARVLFGGVCITFFGMMFDSLMRAEGNVRVPATWAMSTPSSSRSRSATWPARWC
jgi:Na+-driven multidrug efflux pump